MLPASKRYDYVDILRGLAVLFVVLIHTSIYFNINYFPVLFQNLITGGKYGVQLFYFASAFTIMLSYHSRYDKETNPTRNFFIRRFFRIAPLYYLAIIFYLLYNGLAPNYWTGGTQPITAINILSNFLFLHGFNPYWINSIVPGGWSIAIEMVFYCLMPFLFIKVKSINSALWFFVITLLLRFTVLAVLTHIHVPIENKTLWGEYLYLFLPNQLPVFAIGFIYYFIVKGIQFQSISWHPLLAIALLFILTIVGQIGINQDSNFIELAMTFIILATALSKMNFKNVFASAIKYIGTVSYSVYLVHFAVLYMLTKFGVFRLYNQQQWRTGIIYYAGTYCVVLLCSVIIATITYRLVELPAQKFGKKLIERLEKN